MRGNIISYMEMCQQEGVSLQKGMNFRLRGGHSVLLMSLRPSSPYADEVVEDGSVLIYEGHDVANTAKIKNPRAMDQPEVLRGGKLTENGKFHRAAQNYKK